MRILTILLAGALLGACQSTPDAEQTPAGVEERSPTTGAATGAESRGGAGKPVPSVDLTAKKPASGLSALKDPASILSKRSIYYDYDKYDIKDEFKPLVEAHAKYLREHRDAKMLIQGNTDERGGREYNIALGQRRAEGVKKMLILLGAREEQVEAVSLGEEKPRETGSTEAAHARNRRSDMLYGGEY